MFWVLYSNCLNSKTASVRKQIFHLLRIHAFFCLLADLQHNYSLYWKKNNAYILVYLSVSNQIPCHLSVTVEGSKLIPSDILPIDID